MEAKDIHKEMLPMYGEHCLSRQHPAVERAVSEWFRQQPKEFFTAGFQGLVKRWDKCLNLYGNYVEK